jgi:gamma-glutamyltranspeptidase/glutathione hydrolase
MFLLEALGMLRTFDLATCRARRWYHLHLMAEVFKRMFRDEASVNGDPERTIIPAARVASDDYAFERMRGIELGRAEHPAQVGPGKIDDGCTTQISVMDSAGNAVSLTITLSSLFGTANTVEGAGFMLNNEMQNYNADSSHPNALRPHSRVVTSLVPTLLFRNGETFCAVGTPGGDLILSTLVQVIVNLVDFSMEPEDALAAPRIYSSFTQRVLEMEPGYPAEASDMLRSLGHELRQYDTRLPYFGAVQAVVRDPESRRLTGASDPRRSGEPRGE